MFALALAVAASAFTAPSSANEVDDPEYQWFAPGTNQYLGIRSIAAQEDMCPGAGATCANAYTEKTTNNLPSGSFVTSVQELP